VASQETKAKGMREKGENSRSKEWNRAIDHEIEGNAE
jgi:hypothetical protein